MSIKLSDWETVGHIGVDAGICWIGDPCYIFHKEGASAPKELGIDWGDFCDILEKKQDNYKKKHAQFNYDAGHDGLGVCVSTGYGDGFYPVQVRYCEETGWGKRVAEVRVVFISDEDLEDDDDFLEDENE